MIITIEKTITLNVDVRLVEPGQRAITSADPNSCQPEIKPAFECSSIEIDLDSETIDLPLDILDDSDYEEIQRFAEEEIGWND